APRRLSGGVLVGVAIGMAMVLGGAWALSRRGATDAPALPRSSVVASASLAPAAGTTSPAAAPSPAAVAAAPLTTRLTRDDSLAIAAAVERRLAQEERARRAKAQKEMSPAEMEALRARAWTRYA